MIGQITEAQIQQIGQIANKTQAELGVLQQKYAVADKVSYSVNIIAIGSIVAIYLLALLSDLANVFPKWFEPLFKKKPTAPGSNRPKKQINKEESDHDPFRRRKINLYDAYFFDVENQLLRAMIRKKQIGRMRNYRL